MTPSMPGIVLTCQAYMPLAEHMIDRYAAAWSGHPFTFRLPDGPAARAMAGRHPGRVELLPTREGEGRGRFRAAVLGLLADLEDDAWVWWCIDDKYVTWLDTAVAEAVARLAATCADPGVAGLCFALPATLARECVDPNRVLQAGGLRFLRRTSYRKIWLHQFLRVKVLRTLFDGFPETIASAKEMDALIRSARLPGDHGLWVLDRNAVQFGESTTRGRLTRNCAASLRRGRGLPPGFEIGAERILIGRRPGLTAAFAGMFRQPSRPATPAVEASRTGMP